MLAHGAVHGAFAGYTGVTVGLVNTHVRAWWLMCGSLPFSSQSSLPASVA
jgi:hypothetical protein